MRLIKVYANQESFRTVEFNPSGLSFIVAKQKNPGIGEKGKTYNGVGKSLLIRIIHFCLGASVKDNESFCEKLPGWEFTLDFEIKQDKYMASRTTGDPAFIVLNGEKLTIKKFNNTLEVLCFDIPKDVSFLSFRSLLPFFIRPTRDSYTFYNRTGKVGKEYQILLYNAFLLGLDVSLAQKKYDIRIEQKKIADLEKSFKKDALLKDFFLGNKNLKNSMLDIDEQIKKLDENLLNFKVAEDYYDMQREADKIEKRLFAINNHIILLQSNIENIDKSITIEPDMKKEDIKTIYGELEIYFSERLTKTLDDLEDFYEKLISNRKRRLIEQQNQLKLENHNEKIKSQKLQKELDKLMKYLGEHQALDLFVNLSSKSAELKAEQTNLNKFRDLQTECEKRKEQLQAELIELNEATSEYLNEIGSDTEALREYFRSLAKMFYPYSPSGLSIEKKSGKNQSVFNIDARIESDASDGINNVKIFCYDMTLLFKGSNHKIHFIFHDSRLFDGIDERQKTEIFRIVQQKFSDTNKQYIASINQNQLDEIRKKMSEEEFENIVSQNTVLTLTDDSDTEKLLGIQVDIGDS